MKDRAVTYLNMSVLLHNIALEVAFACADRSSWLLVARDIKCGDE